MSDLVHFERLDDPIVEQHGHAVQSSYVEHFWLPIIGPTTLWLLRRADAMLTASTNNKVAVDRADLASMIGVGGQSKNSPLGRSLARLVAFHCAQEHAGVYYVRAALDSLSARHLSRLPGPLQAAHALTVRASQPATLKAAVGQ